MAEDAPSTPAPHRDPPWLVSLVRAEPRAPLTIPYFAYLLLLGFSDFLPVRWLPVVIALHVGAVFWVIRLFCHHYPPLGRPVWLLAIPAGLFAAWMWVAGQHALDGVMVAGHDLGARFFLYPGEAKPYDPTADFGNGSLFWVYAVLKIARACTVVPIVEELFWRGFILHALINLNRPEEVPWGKFAWTAMIGSSLLSILQHPDNWAVSVVCWLLFNALFYWTRSLRCLVIVHAVTNFALYAYVLRAGDWRFW